MALNPTTEQLLSPEFTDILSEQMLLQPTPEFVFARWAYSALVQNQASQQDGFDMAKLQLQEGRFANSGVTANLEQATTSGMGGPLLLSQGMSYPDMFIMVPEAGGPGTTFKLNRPRLVEGATTAANRKLGGTTKLFGNSQPLTMDQVDVTIYEYGGPGDPSSGAPTPLDISLFTQWRSKHDLLSYAGKNLRYDRYKFLDDQIINNMIPAFGGTATGTTRGGDVSSNANFTSAGAEPMSFDLLPKISEALKGRFVPGLQNYAKYVLVLHPHQYQQIQNDVSFQRLAVFDKTGLMNPLFPGYKATINDFIICESVRLPTILGGPGNAVTLYQGIAIAPSSFAWAVGLDARAVRDKNDDGGRFARFGWISHEGFQIADDRFGQVLVTD